MNEISTRQTSLEILGIEPEKIETVKSPAVKANLRARSGFPVRSLTSSEILEFLSDQIEKVAANLGQKQVGADIISAITTDFPRTLNQSFFNWTREELAEAWRLGSSGQLGGDEVHLSARNLVSWIKQYDEKHRKPAFKKIRDLKHSKKASNTNTPKTEEMTAEQKKTALNEALESFRRGELKGGSFYYRLLVDLGLVKMDKKKGWDYIGRANAQIIAECKEMSTSASLRSTAKGRIEQIKQISQENPKSVPEFVKSRSQLLVVEDYFLELPKDYKF